MQHPPAHSRQLKNLVLITWIACSVHVNVGEEMRIIESTVLAEVFAALQQNEGLAWRVFQTLPNDPPGPCSQRKLREFILSIR